MPQHSVADNPNLIPPSGPNWRLIGGIVLGLLIIGVIIAVPVSLKWQEEQAAHVERGKMMGAVYPVSINGQHYQLELGWANNHLAVLSEPALPEDAVIELSGDFGKENLSWSPEYAFFGPTQADVDPFGHRPVEIRIAQNGKTLWSGKRWAWGIPQSGHHH